MSWTIQSTIKGGHVLHAPWSIKSQFGSVLHVEHERFRPSRPLGRRSVPFPSWSKNPFTEYNIWSTNSQVDERCRYRHKYHFSFILGSNFINVHNHKYSKYFDGELPLPSCICCHLSPGTDGCSETIYFFINSSVHCAFVSSGDVTVCPIVRSWVKIS